MSDTMTHTPQAGMDHATGRCGTCDSRQCGITCDAREGYVYVGSVGWVSPERAAEIEASGRTICWTDRWSHL